MFCVNMELKYLTDRPSVRSQGCHLMGQVAAFQFQAKSRSCHPLTLWECDKCITLLGCSDGASKMLPILWAPYVVHLMLQFLLPSKEAWIPRSWHKSQTFPPLLLERQTSRYGTPDLISHQVNQSDLDLRPRKTLISIPPLAVQYGTLCENAFAPCVLSVCTY